jgi:hypothetical protein
MPPMFIWLILGSSNRGIQNKKTYVLDQAEKLKIRLSNMLFHTLEIFRQQTYRNKYVPPNYTATYRKITSKTTTTEKFTWNTSES